LDVVKLARKAALFFWGDAGTIALPISMPTFKVVRNNKNRNLLMIKETSQHS
jgi:hypothetical protein